MSHKNVFVLDTSALIFNPNVYQDLHHSEVVIPIAVLSELDNLKKQMSEAGKNARVCIRLLDELSKNGDLNAGIKLENNILLRVEATYLDLNKEPYLGLGEASYGDTQILACLQYIVAQHPKNKVVLLSNDINLRIKAKSRGIEAESREIKRGNIADLYAGMQVIVNEQLGADLQQNGFVDPRKCGLKEMKLQECVVFQDDNDTVISMGRKIGHNKIQLVKKQYPWSLNPRNKEQVLAVDMLMDPNIDLITLIGIAGCGKSLIALACALEMVLNKKMYDRLIVYRPFEPVGNEIGFLPGSMEEKLLPWMGAVMDSFEVLFSNRDGDWRKNLEMYIKKHKIELEAMTFIRGRSIANSIILIDEAQNISQNDIKTLLTRAGQGSKIVLTGDISQIDTKNLDVTSNGLTYVIDCFQDTHLSGHITFTKGERSRLASMAAELL